MSRYFKTDRRSETAKKLLEFQKKSNDLDKVAREVANKYGFLSYSEDLWAAAGGISGFGNYEVGTPDPNIWKLLGEDSNGTKVYYPKGNTKVGKKIKEELEALPTISRNELNACVGMKHERWNRIGYSFSSKQWIGFVIGDDWKFNIPFDCTEITITEFNKLFK